MTDITSLSERVDFMEKLILSLPTTNSLTNSELTEILKWYNIKKETDRLQGVNSNYVALSLKSEMIMHDLRDFIPQLPLLYPLSRDEFINLQQNVFDEFEFDVCIINHMFLPNHEIIDDKSIYYFKFQNSTQHLKLLNSQFMLKYTILEFDDSNVTLEITLECADEDNKCNQFAFREIITQSIFEPIFCDIFLVRYSTIGFKTVTPNQTPDLNLDIVRYSSHSKVYMKYRLVKGNINQVEPISQYQEPTLTLLYESNVIEIDEKATNLKHIHTETDCFEQEVIHVIYSDIIQGVNWDLDIIDYEEKILKDYLHRLAGMQHGLYQALSEVAQAEMIEFANENDEQFIASTVSALGRIDERLMRVPYYKDMSFENNDSSKYGGYLLKYLPIYVQPEDSQIYVERFTTLDSTLCFIDGINNEENMGVVQIINGDTSPMVENVNYVILETDEYIVRLDGIIIPGEDYEVKSISQHPAMMRHNYTRWSGTTEQQLTTAWHVTTPFAIKPLHTFLNNRVLHIKGVYILIKGLSGTFIPRKGEAELFVSYGYNFDKIRLTNPRPAEVMTTDQGVMYGAGFNVDKIIAIKNPESIREINFSAFGDFREHNSSGPLNEGGIEITYWTALKLEYQIPLRWKFEALKPKYWEPINTFELNIDRNIVSKLGVIIHDRFNEMIPGTLIKWSELFSPQSLENREGNTMIDRVVASIIFSLEGDGEIPPFELGLKMSSDLYLTGLENQLRELESSLDSVLERLITVEQQVSALQNQFNRFLESQQSDVLDAIMNIFLDMALTSLLPLSQIGIKMVYKALKSGTGYLFRNGGLITQFAKSFKGNKQSKIIPNDIASLDFHKSGIINSKGLKREDIIKGERPLYRKSNDINAIDLSDKIDLMSAYKTGGKYYDLYSIDGDVSQLATKNKLIGESIISEMKYYHRPLAFLPKPVGDFLHKFGQRIPSVKRKMMYNKMQTSFRLPSHANAVYDDMVKRTDGLYKVRTFFGIGEANKFGNSVGDKGAGIGGVRYETKITSVDTNGTLIGNTMSYTYSGYTTSDVQNIYITLFKKDDFRLSPAQRWTKITTHLDRKIANADSPVYKYIPDRSMSDTLFHMLSNPPPFNYNLFKNNCQSYLIDIMEYLQKGIPPVKWNADVITAYERARTFSFNRDLDRLVSSFLMLTKGEMS